ncbi:MAG: putative dehydrogenase [Verrucomicrobiales bacterium]|jgi:predicted dehydrogenase
MCASHCIQIRTIVSPWNTMSEESYGLSKTHASTEGDAPVLDYLPRKPVYLPRIGLIGAGGITEYHLRAYSKHGLNVVAIANPTLEKAQLRRDEFYPQANVYTDAGTIFADDSIDVVDIATYPNERVALIEQAIDAGKHVLSQKPFVTDLDVGQRLVDKADARGVLLAVNQNGRWAPHYRYISQAIRAGIIGEISTIDFAQQWDHRWTVGTTFEEIHHLLLYDFGVHWFDFAHCFTGIAEAERVYASVRSATYQKARPPFLASSIIDYPNAQVRINFNAHVAYGQRDGVVICGEHGTIRSTGEGLNQHKVVIETEGKRGVPALDGDWFSNGFEGTMLELLNAISENRQPENNARDNLASLALCFAAVRSADCGEPQVPGTIRRLL